jgi:hypothetical protein
MGTPRIRVQAKATINIEQDPARQATRIAIIVSSFGAKAAESVGVFLKLRSEEVQFSCDLFSKREEQSANMTAVNPK